jgi:hypothetical protein
MLDPDVIAIAEEIRRAAYVETYGANIGTVFANRRDPLQEVIVRRIAEALSDTGDGGMLIKIEETGEYAQTNARHAVMRVQKNEDQTAVRVVTLDGGHLTVPAARSDDGSVDPGALQALCDKVAATINNLVP